MEAFAWLVNMSTSNVVNQDTLLSTTMYKEPLPLSPKTKAKSFLNVKVTSKFDSLIQGKCEKSF